MMCSVGRVECRCYCNRISVMHRFLSKGRRERVLMPYLSRLD